MIVSGIFKWVVVFEFLFLDVVYNFGIMLVGIVDDNKKDMIKKFVGSLIDYIFVGIWSELNFEVISFLKFDLIIVDVECYKNIYK